MFSLVCDNMKPRCQFVAVAHSALCHLVLFLLQFLFIFEIVLIAFLTSLSFLQTLSHTLTSSLSFPLSLYCVLHSHKVIYMLYNGVSLGLVCITASSKAVLSKNDINKSSILGVLFSRKSSTILQEGIHAYILIIAM